MKKYIESEMELLKIKSKDIITISFQSRVNMDNDEEVGEHSINASKLL